MTIEIICIDGNDIFVRCGAFVGMLLVYLYPVRSMENGTMVRHFGTKGAEADIRFILLLVEEFHRTEGICMVYFSLD